MAGPHYLALPSLLSTGPSALGNRLPGVARSQEILVPFGWVYNNGAPGNFEWRTGLEILTQEASESTPYSATLDT